MSSYPHMLSEDTVVWSKFLKSEADRIARVWYDVHVGTGIEPISPADDISRAVALGVSRKRIDVVAKVGGGFWVVEVKPFASMLAIGQALTYSRLFSLEYQPPGAVWPIIVCDAVDEDLLSEFDELGVGVFVNT